MSEANYTPNYTASAVLLKGIANRLELDAANLRLSAEQRGIPYPVEVVAALNNALAVVKEAGAKAERRESEYLGVDWSELVRVFDDEDNDREAVLMECSTEDIMAELKRRQSNQLADRTNVAEARHRFESKGLPF